MAFFSFKNPFTAPDIADVVREQLRFTQGSFLMLIIGLGLFGALLIGYVIGTRLF